MAIPKIMSFYFGAEKISWLRYMTVWSFKKYNPEWKVKFYVPFKLTVKKDMAQKDHNGLYTGGDYFEELKKLDIEIIKFDMESIGFSNDLMEVNKSDIVRWHLMATTGGVYSDTDILYFKPIDSIIERHGDMCLCLWTDYKSKEKVLKNLIGFIFSIPNNSFFKYVLEKAKNTLISQSQSVGNYLLDSEFKSIDSVEKKFPELDVELLNIDCFYAYDGYTRRFLFENGTNLFKPNSIGLHWFGGCPQFDVWESALNEKTYKNYNNIVCNKLKEICG